MGLMFTGIILLINPVTRRHEGALAVACIAVFVGTWIDKGMGMISGGFVPSPLEYVHEYIPTVPELVISLGVWCVGFLVLSALFKMAISVKEEVGA
jgi:molybdopterin-containing oxidoreductase family membrane subunit